MLIFLIFIFILFFSLFVNNTIEWHRWWARKKKLEKHILVALLILLMCQYTFEMLYTQTWCFVRSRWERRWRRCALGINATWRGAKKNLFAIRVCCLRWQLLPNANKIPEWDLYSLLDGRNEVCRALLSNDGISFDFSFPLFVTDSNSCASHVDNGM